MSEQPPQTHRTGEKLDLILWRLEKIETQIEHKTVSRQEWNTHHEHLKGRISELEERSERTTEDKRKIVVGVVIALALPLSKWALDFIQVTNIG